MLGLLRTSQAIIMKQNFKNPARRVINLLLYFCLCLLLGTGALMTWRLPPASRGGGGRGQTVLGWDRHDWGDLHFWLGLGFVALVALHLALNVQWLKRIAANKRLYRLWLALLLGLLLIAGLLLLPVNEAGSDAFQGGGGRGRGGGF